MIKEINMIKTNRINGLHFGEIILIILLAASFLVKAQIRKDPEERTKEMKEKLNLSEEQSEKILQIYINTDKEIESKMQGGSTNRVEMLKGIRDIMENTDEEIFKILNEEQQEKYKKITNERKENYDKMKSNRNFN
jgi:DNA gyrase/topoisomerase IV subunit A